MTDKTFTDATAKPAVGFPVQQPVRPLVWARKDQIQHASTRGGLMCAMYPNTDRRADLQPLYDQAALDAAVAEANRRQNAAWALMAEKLVAAERERCASLCENWPTPDCGGWTLDGLSDAIRAGA